MSGLGDIPSSALFWTTFWPCLSFGLMALAFFALLVWLQARAEV